MGTCDDTESSQARTRFVAGFVHTTVRGFGVKKNLFGIRLPEKMGAGL